MPEARFATANFATFRRQPENREQNARFVDRKFARVSTDLERAEQKVETSSESLRKPLGLFDLVLTQILFVVGSSWVGAAAKLGIPRQTLESKIRRLGIDKYGQKRQSS